jgi:hypothetical protein
MNNVMTRQPTPRGPSRRRPDFDWRRLTAADPCWSRSCLACVCVCVCVYVCVGDDVPCASERPVLYLIPCLFVGSLIEQHHLSVGRAGVAAGHTTAKLERSSTHNRRSEPPKRETWHGPHLEGRSDEQSIRTISMSPLDGDRLAGHWFDNILERPHQQAIEARASQPAVVRKRDGQNTHARPTPARLVFVIVIDSLAVQQPLRVYTRSSWDYLPLSLA